MSAVLNNLEHLPFSLDQGIARRAAIGLIVLATDHTIEHEWRQMMRLDGVAFYESRLYNSAVISPENLAEMEKDIKGATTLIRPGEKMDVIAFGCTSGSMVIGEERVFARIREARPGIACTTPITAALAGFKALKANRIALLTPYVASINNWMRTYIEDRGVSVPVMGSFNHENDNEVARIDADSITNAVLSVGSLDEVDAVFVSCTSLRVAHLIEPLEQKLGKPVLSSNHAMAWHSLRLAGVTEQITGWGNLFRVQALELSAHFPD